MRNFSRVKHISGGFSLAEVMVGAAIFAVIVMGMLAVLNISNAIWHVDTFTLSLQQESRDAITGMARELSQVDPSSVITITAGVDGYDNDISFIISDKVTDPAVPVNYSVRYYLSNDGQLLRENPALTGAPKVLANDIEYLSFSHVGDFLEIQMKLKRTVRGRDYCFPVPCETNPPTRTLKEKVRLRNG